MLGWLDELFVEHGYFCDTQLSKTCTGESGRTQIQKISATLRSSPPTTLGAARITRAPDGKAWVACRPGFFLSVRVLSRLFRRRFLEELQQAHQSGKLKFFGEHITLADAKAFNDWLAPQRKCEWVVYAKRPFAGPEAVLAYLSRYTHRVAISNSRLLAMDERGVRFRWKDYRVKEGSKGKKRYKAMTLAPEEFMRRVLLHVLPGGFHRIRHYGLLANGSRTASLALARELLCTPKPEPAAVDGKESALQIPRNPHECL